MYTGLSTYPDLETRPYALYSGKLNASIVAGVILGSVAAVVRNRYARRDNRRHKSRYHRLNFRLSFPRRSAVPESGA